MAKPCTMLICQLLCVALFLFLHTPETETGRGASESQIDIDTPLASMADFSGQEAFAFVNSAAAHQYADGTNEIIAVIDGGFDLAHPSLDATRVVDQHDFLDGDTDVGESRDNIDQDGVDGPDSMFGHGTAVASLLMALAPGAEVCLYRVMDEEGTASVANIASAIARALFAGATVINISIELDQDHSEISGAVDDAFAAGVTVVAPSGNDGGTTCAYPGAYGNTICVSSVLLDDTLPPAATNSPVVDILAPGTDIIVAYSDSPSGYGRATGTSYATPFISATVAMIRQHIPQAALSRILEKLQNNSVQAALTPAQQQAQMCGSRTNMLSTVD